MENKPRKPWIAGSLSLIQPGLGHVYNGEIRKALLIYILPILHIPGMILCLRSEFIPIFIVSYVILGSAYYIFVFVDAIRTAKRHQDQYSLKSYNKAIAYIGIVLLVTILSTVMTTVIKSNVIQAFKLPAGSMEPTLLIGDHILVDRRISARNPQRGDLIVFEYPVDPTKDFIKRIVAVGGDTVEIRNKELFINGNAVAEPYAVHKEAYTIPAGEEPRDNFGPQIIPANSFFVLGDNRDRSYDSRFWGVVSKDKIKGTVRTIYWSWEKEKMAVRWDRIGLEVH